MKEKRSFLRSDGFQSFLAAIVCIILGLFIGFLVLLAINPSGAGKGIVDVIKNLSLIHI